MRSGDHSGGVKGVRALAGSVVEATYDSFRVRIVDTSKQNILDRMGRILCWSTRLMVLGVDWGEDGKSGFTER